ncbi:MAG: GxxExxY protein [Verrucomicrobiaceae bacterium]|nr:GxxExxY protein [Verrucomicrobiaceae bacterium]
MPIHQPIPTIRPTQAEFGELAYEVMNHVYAIHNDFGRFFDEAVYKNELADRMPGLERELPVIVSHQTFSKPYRLDVLAHRRGLFEFKAVENIVSRHRSQTFNYLLLFDLPHGKIINMRPESVEDEFVNCRTRLDDLRNPSLITKAYDHSLPGAEFFHDTLRDLLHDWGAGLELALYDEALTHFLGGDDQALVPVPVIGSHGHLHDQKMRLLAPDVAFKLTAFTDTSDAFVTHAQRLLRHTSLKAIQWANLTHQEVTFTTIR